MMVADGHLHARKSRPGSELADIGQRRLEQEFAMPMSALYRADATNHFQSMSYEIARALRAIIA
jgi:hypothetical protein